MFLYTYYEKVGTPDRFRWETRWVISHYDYIQFVNYLNSNRNLDIQSQLWEYRGKTVRDTFVLLDNQPVLSEEIEKFVERIEKQEPFAKGCEHNICASHDSWAQYELTPEDIKKVTEMKEKYENENSEEKAEALEPASSIDMRI